MADASQGASAAENWPQQSYAAPATGVVGRPTAAGKQILLTIVTLGIWAIVWVYRQHEDIQKYTGEGVGGALGAVIFFFVSPVTYFLLPNEVETKLYQRSGEQSPVRTIMGLWFLLPIAGPLIWYLKMQEALNTFWIARGAEAP